MCLYFANNSESGYDPQNHRAKSESCNPKTTHKNVAHLVLEVHGRVKEQTAVLSKEYSHPFAELC